MPGCPEGRAGAENRQAQAGQDPVYGPDLLPALIKCWAVLRAPAGRLLAPMLPVLVPLLRRDRELELTDEQAGLLMRMSAATIDRKLAGERARLLPQGTLAYEAGHAAEVPDPGPHLG
jgi:hypothetical protein